MGLDWQLHQRRSSRLAFVDNIDSPQLSDSDMAHFRRVLRMENGELLHVSDGRGQWRPVRFGDNLEVTDEVVTEPAAPYLITIGFAPTKGDRPEWTVQKLTELGVDRIVPLCTERSVVRWSGERARKQRLRFERTAREAAMQCRRVYLPVVDEVTDLNQVFSQFSSVVVADPEGRQIESCDRTFLIGPEGGFTLQERRQADAVRLPGKGILRTETAALAAAVVAIGWRY